MTLGPWRIVMIKFHIEKFGKEMKIVMLLLNTMKSVVNHGMILWVMPGQKNSLTNL